MRKIRSLTASLVALVAVAAIAGPAAAIPADSHQQSDQWYAGKSTIAGSTKSDSQTANGAPKANVYVPPASLYQGTVAPKANVYVPPASIYQGTVARVTSPPATSVPPHASAASTSSTGFDWGSAGIGAAAGIAALMIGLAAAAAMRHRRLEPTA